MLGWNARKGTDMLQIPTGILSGAEKGCAVRGHQAERTATPLAAPSEPPDRRILVEYLGLSLREPHVGITITFRYTPNVSNRLARETFASGAISRFLHFLDNRCFGHRHRRNGHVVGCIAVVEGLRDDNRLHVHLALEIPASMPLEDFSKRIRKAAKAVACVGRIDIGYESSIRWAMYITKDIDSGRGLVLWDVCRRGKP